MAIASKQTHTKSTGHKKRQGLHQKRTPGFMKTYWPYIPMAVIVGLGIMVSTIWSNQSKHAVLGTSTSFSDQSLLNDTNTDRMNKGLGLLTLNNQLDNAAQAKANDMVAKNYWSHVSPSGQTPWSFIVNAGYQYQAAGENLAYGFNSASATLAAWMNSPDHRANILDSEYQNVGFGIANSPNFQGTGPETVIVAMYAEPLTVSSASSQTSSTGSVMGVSTTTPSSTTSSAPLITENQPPSTSVDRIQVLAGGNAPYTAFLAGVFVVGGLGILILRYGRQWQKVAIQSERFILRHPVIDNFLVLVVVVSVVLTKSAGIIR